jgi:hypothetical protein
VCGVGFKKENDKMGKKRRKKKKQNKPTSHHVENKC